MTIRSVADLQRTLDSKYGRRTRDGYADIERETGSLPGATPAGDTCDVDLTSYPMGKLQAMLGVESDLKLLEMIRHEIAQRRAVGGA